MSAVPEARPQPIDRLVTVPFALVTIAVFLGAANPNLFVLGSRYLAGLHYGRDEIGIIMSAFHAGMLPTIPLVGRALDRGHRRAVLIGGCLVGGLGGLGFEWCDGMWAFAAARVVQGAGFGAVLVSGSAYVAEIAPEGRLAQALGFAGVLTLAAQAVAPGMGEAIVAGAGWVWLFRVAFGFGVAGALVALFLPELAPSSSRTGGPPAARGARAAIAAMLLAGVGFGAVIAFVANYFDEVRIGTVTPYFVGYVAAAIAARLTLGHLADRLGRRAVAIPALIGHCVALVLLAEATRTWQTAAIGALYGVSHGVYYPALQALIVDRAPTNARARAVGASNLAFGAGVFAAVLSLGYVAEATGYPVIYLIAAGMGALAAAVVWLDRG